MLVQTQSKGRGMVGVLVGDSNVRRYFSREFDHVDLQLDHLQISCRLNERFFDGEASIFDPRLCAWLESKNCNRPGCHNPTPLTMIPDGPNRFRLLAVKSAQTVKFAQTLKPVQSLQTVSDLVPARLSGAPPAAA